MNYIVKLINENPVFDPNGKTTLYYNTEHETFVKDASILTEEEAISIIDTYRDRGYKAVMEICN